MAYWLQAGCAWQLLPNDLPPWQNRARIWCAAITVTEPIGAALVRLALRKLVKYASPATRG